MYDLAGLGVYLPLLLSKLDELAEEELVRFRCEGMVSCPVPNGEGDPDIDDMLVIDALDPLLEILCR